MEKKSIDKTFRYKGWLCSWNKTESLYYLYTPDEQEQPAGFRTQETECSTQAQCREFINSY